MSLYAIRAFVSINSALAVDLAVPWNPHPASIWHVTPLRQRLRDAPKEAGRVTELILIGMDADNGAQGSIWSSLDPAFQGRGYATEAFVELVRVGFEEFKLRRI